MSLPVHLQNHWLPPFRVPTYSAARDTTGDKVSPVIHHCWPNNSASLGAPANGAFPHHMVESLVAGVLHTCLQTPQERCYTLLFLTVSTTIWWVCQCSNALVCGLLRSQVFPAWKHGRVPGLQGHAGASTQRQHDWRNNTDVLLEVRHTCKWAFPHCMAESLVTQVLHTCLLHHKRHHRR